MCFRFQEITKRLDYSSVHYIEILKYLENKASFQLSLLQKF